MTATVNTDKDVAQYPTGTAFLKPGTGEVWRLRGWSSDYLAWGRYDDENEPPKVPNWSIAKPDGYYAAGSEAPYPLEVIWIPDPGEAQRLTAGSVRFIAPAVGARAWPRYDDGVAVVRAVERDGDVVYVDLSWLPDPRDEDAWDDGEWKAEDRIARRVLASSLRFDEFPTGHNPLEEV